MEEKTQWVKDPDHGFIWNTIDHLLYWREHREKHCVSRKKYMRLCILGAFGAHQFYAKRPVLGLLFAFAEDILSFFLTGGGGYPFFPGYTLTTMLGVLTYALFLYRAPLRVWRIFCAKLVTNVQNVVLGALWIAILNSNGRFSLEAWYASASLSAVKNLIMLPVQTVLLVLLLRALQPALQRTGMLPRQGAGARPD